MLDFIRRRFAWSKFALAHPRRGLGNKKKNPSHEKIAESRKIYKTLGESFFGYRKSDKIYILREKDS